jgi:hypothetical protein
LDDLGNLSQVLQGANGFVVKVIGTTRRTLPDLIVFYVLPDEFIWIEAYS